MTVDVIIEQNSFVLNRPFDYILSQIFFQNSSTLEFIRFNSTVIAINGLVTSLSLVTWATNTLLTSLGGILGIIVHQFGGIYPPFGVSGVGEPIIRVQSLSSPDFVGQQTALVRPLPESRWAPSLFVCASVWECIQVVVIDIAEKFSDNNHQI